MFIWIWKHDIGTRPFDLFIRGYERKQRGRRRPLVPADTSTNEAFLTAEEVGQLLGGN